MSRRLAQEEIRSLLDHFCWRLSNVRKIRPARIDITLKFQKVAWEEGWGSVSKQIQMFERKKIFQALALIS
jgi:hypothetical protein